LTGERIHTQCFVCGPNGSHYQPPIPPYPAEWDYFIDDRKKASISRKLNNIFCLTALGSTTAISRSSRPESQLLLW
ncbi:hypothetical protein DFH08DRAFT_636278, partial [Mycena albidolilacea]